MARFLAHACAAAAVLGAIGVGTTVVDADSGRPPPRVTVGLVEPAATVPKASVEASRQVAAQTVGVSVRPGPFELRAPEQDVVLHRVGDAWVGSLAPVRLVDARGSLAGWEVRWAATGLEVDGIAVQLEQADVLVEPTQPVVVHGDQRGLRRGVASPLTDGRGVLFGADAGAGGGTYEAGGRVTVRLPAPGDGARAVRLRLDFTLG